jgi:hypothetical protein
VEANFVAHITSVSSRSTGRAPHRRCSVPGAFGGSKAGFCRPAAGWTAFLVEDAVRTPARLHLGRYRVKYRAWGGASPCRDGRGGICPSDAFGRVLGNSSPAHAQVALLHSYLALTLSFCGSTL